MAEATTSVTPKAVAVPLTSLQPAPWKPRSIWDECFQNLCRSIQQDLEFLRRRPVRAQADGTVCAGNMRYRPAQYLGHETIPAIVEDVSDQLCVASGELRVEKQARGVNISYGDLVS
jgi:hypothetical protein